MKGLVTRYNRYRFTSNIILGKVKHSTHIIDIPKILVSIDDNITKARSSELCSIACVDAEFILNLAKLNKAIITIESSKLDKNKVNIFVLHFHKVFLLSRWLDLPCPY